LNYREILQERVNRQIIGCEPEDFPQSRYILKLAEHEYINGNILAPENALPVYLRNTVTG
jgi:hypothetical protein